MQQIRDVLRRPLAIFSIAISIAALTLSACGSSGSSSTTTRTSAAAALAALKAKYGHSATGHSATGGSTTNTSPTTRPRFGALRECLRKHGVNLPAQRGAGGLFLGGAKLPSGTSRAQLQTAARKCLGVHGAFLNRAGPAGPNGPRGGRFRKALSAFASCLRRNGVPVPAPNTSGNGPVFSTKGIDTSSAKFKAASAKCRPMLVGAFGLRGARPGAGAQPTG